MEKIVRLTESDLARIVKRVIVENEEGFGFLNSKGEIDEELDSTNNSSFIDFLKQQGFKDWSGGKPSSYGMNFHYYSRKPSTPANLSCSVGQKVGKKTIDISIVFNNVIEKAERYKTIEEFQQKSPISKIEKLVGKDFDVSDDGRFSLIADNQPEDIAKRIIILYNQIRLVGPYSK